MSDHDDLEVFEPVPIAFLFADRIITEEGNKKKTIVGAFSRFNAPTFPFGYAPWFIYIAFTNVEGKHAFSCYIVLDKEKQFIATFGGEVNILAKKGVVELVFPVMNSVFPIEADYTCVFTLDGKQVMTRTLEVKQVAAAG